MKQPLCPSWCSWAASPGSQPARGSLSEGPETRRQVECGQTWRLRKEQAVLKNKSNNWMVRGIAWSIIKSMNKTLLQKGGTLRILRYWCFQVIGSGWYWILVKNTSIHEKQRNLDSWYQTNWIPASTIFIRNRTFVRSSLPLDNNSLIIVATDPLGKLKRLLLSCVPLDMNSSSPLLASPSHWRTPALSLGLAGGKRWPLRNAHVHGLQWV